MLEFKSDVIKDVNFTKIYHLFAAVEGVHSIITFALREGGGFLKMRTKANGGERGSSCLVERSQRKFFFID